MKTILIVDDEPNNLKVLRQILKNSYQLIFAPNGQKAIDAATTHLPDMILLDIMMPDMDGYKVCKILKSNKTTKEIPVIFVTAMSDMDDEIKGFEAGGVDYIIKPVSGPIVHKRIETHLSLIRAKELEDSQREAIFMLGEAGHYNDTDTGVHIWRMAAYTHAIAIAAGWNERMAERLELAASMHDMGKIGIPDEILKAPRKLTKDEYTAMQEHSIIGANILKKSHLSLFQLASEVAMYHHEKYDGNGYPEGLSGENIPESARIVALADVFDALTMRRPYKEPWSDEDALKEIQKCSGTHFDPKLVDIFVDIFPKLCDIKLKWEKNP